MFFSLQILFFPFSFVSFLDIWKSNSIVLLINENREKKSQRRRWSKSNNWWHVDILSIVACSKIDMNNSMSLSFVQSTHLHSILYDCSVGLFRNIGVIVYCSTVYSFFIIFFLSGVTLGVMTNDWQNSFDHNGNWHTRKRNTYITLLIHLNTRCMGDTHTFKPDTYKIIWNWWRQNDDDSDDDDDDDRVFSSVFFSISHATIIFHN